MQQSIFTKKIIDKNLFKAPARILDVGCGNGADAITFCNNGFVVDAFDKNAERIEIAIKSMNNCKVNFSNSTIENYIFPKETYQFIYAKNVLPFLDSKETIFSVVNIIKESLVDCGYLYITLMGNDDPFVNEGKAIGIDFSEALKFLIENGFIVIEVHSFKENGEFSYKEGSKLWHWHQFLLQKRD